VEDRARPTNALASDLSTAQGKSCTAFGILKEALATHDQQRINNAACHIIGAQYADRKSGLPHDAPTAADMLDFARNSAGTPRACVLAAMTTVLTHMPEPAEPLGQRLGQTIGPAQGSPNRRSRRQRRPHRTRAVGGLHFHERLAGKARRSASRLCWSQRCRHWSNCCCPAAVPRTVPTPEYPAPAMSLAELIGRAGNKLTATFRTTGGSRIASRDLIRALAALSLIAPDDPRVQSCSEPSSRSRWTAHNLNNTMHNLKNAAIGTKLLRRSKSHSST
jgi:hypothetical protein